MQVSSDLLQGQGLWVQQTWVWHKPSWRRSPLTPPPMSLPEAPGHAWASLGQSLVGLLLLSPGSCCTPGFVCALLESASPVLWKFWRLCGGVNGDLLQEGLCQTQVCCTQSPCPCGSPLLTRISSGDAQRQFCLCLCGVHKVWLSPLSISGRNGV